MRAQLVRAVGVDRTADMKLGVFSRSNGCALPSESLPSFVQALITHGLKRNCSMRGAGFLYRKTPFLLALIRALASSSREGRPLIVAACRNFACFALHYASVKFGHRGELVHWCTIARVLNGGWSLSKWPRICACLRVKSGSGTPVAARLEEVVSSIPPF
jgi:hypothetical protein